MAICEKCGNDYPKAFEVLLAGEKHRCNTAQQIL